MTYSNITKRMLGAGLLALSTSVGAFATPTLIGLTTSSGVDIVDKTLTLGSSSSLKVFSNEDFKKGTLTFKKGDTELFTIDIKDSYPSGIEGTPEYKAYNMFSGTQAKLIARYQDNTIADGDKITVEASFTDMDDVVYEHSGSCSFTISSLPGFKEFNPNPDSSPLFEIGKANWYAMMDQNVYSVNCEVTQNGEKKADIAFTGSVNATTGAITPTTYAQIKKTEQQALFDTMSLEPGEWFTVTVKSVDYQYLIDKTQQLTYELPDNSWSASYFYAGEAGNMTDISHPKGKTISSWVPADGDGNVATFKFDRPIDIAAIQADLTYGSMEGGSEGAIKRVIPSFNDDHTEMTIDMRGMQLASSVLVPGGFHDENGNVVAGPTTILLSLNNVRDLNGASIMCPITTGGTTIQWPGAWTQSYTYDDISLPAPRLTGAKFYASSNPSEILEMFDDTCDTMKLFVGNSNSFTQADVRFYYDDADYVIPNIAASSAMIVAIPAEVITRGSEGLAVTLDNVVYIHDDGLIKTVNPLVFSSLGLLQTVNSIEEIQSLARGTKVRYNLGSGVRVTMNQGSYCFIEDNTRGLMIDPETNYIFEEGTRVKGSLVGTYLGSRLFAPDATESELTNEPADISTGLAAGYAEMVTPSNYYRLVTVSSNFASFDYDATQGLMILSDEIVVISDFCGEDFFYPEGCNRITGILFYMEGQTTNPLIIMRNADDAILYTPQTGIESTITEQEAEPVIYTITGTRVAPNAPLSPGMYIINGKKVLVTK